MLNTADIPLGKKTLYVNNYCPSLLYAIPRHLKRADLNISLPLPFTGTDIWNAYELSWLEAVTQKPRIALVEFYIPCDSTHLIESKSLKLYLNSFHQTGFNDELSLKTTLETDLSHALHAPVHVNLSLPPFKSAALEEFSARYLDDLAVNITAFLPAVHYLSSGGESVEEKLYSNLLKSNCPITQQPDWASIYIHYVGQRIAADGLLKYIISFRDHTDFAEHCVERIYMDILNHCQPTQLTVYARFTRRGGIDINPFRSNFETSPPNVRNQRQ